MDLDGEVLTLKKKDKMEETLYDKAHEAIEELFSDKSVTQEEAKENLESLIGEIQVMIDSLDV